MLHIKEEKDISKQIYFWIPDFIIFDYYFLPVDIISIVTVLHCKATFTWVHLRIVVLKQKIIVCKTHTGKHWSGKFLKSGKLND